MTRKRQLLLDEMLSGSIAAQLRGRGHDVVAVVDDRAMLSTPDEELLSYATTEGRALVTANVRDFAPLHALWSSRGRTHAGLIYVVNRTFPNDGSFIGAMVAALDAMVISDLAPGPGAETYLQRLQPSTKEEFSSRRA